MTETNDQNDAPQHGFQFPMDIEIRAMIDSSDESINQVVDFMKEFWGNRLLKVNYVNSRKGNWLSVKSHVIANSREELVEAYTKLKALPCVKMTL